jgi:putative ABC transport system permease protein
MNPLPVAFAMMRRHAVICGAFVFLIALAVGTGGAITAQERALRHGSARAADPFPLIVAAPGSQTDLLLKVVFLQPGSVELLQGEPLKRLMAEDRADFVAPIGFGDSFEGDPIVGTIPALIDHLAAGGLQGRVFSNALEAVAGATSPLKIGDTFHAAHGHGPEAESGDYHPQTLTVVGRLPPTGSPWDKAVLVPIEFVWQVHGLGTGHGPAPEHAGESAGDHHEGEGDEHEHAAVEADVPIGPPFDLEALPGIPAAVIKPRTLAEAYGLRNTWRTTETTAFFPAEVLVQLYELIGDVRVVMSALAVATQTLLVAAILAGILILMRLYTQRFAVLRALGAPRLYIFAVVWTFSFALIAGGAALGLLVAAALAGSVSSIFERASGIAMTAAIGAPEFALAAGIAVVGALLASVPALLLYRQPVVEGLRGA